MTFPVGIGASLGAAIAVGLVQVGVVVWVTIWGFRLVRELVEGVSGDRGD